MMSLTGTIVKHELHNQNNPPTALSEAVYSKCSVLCQEIPVRIDTEPLRNEPPPSSHDAGQASVPASMCLLHSTWHHPLGHQAVTVTSRAREYYANGRRDRPNAGTEQRPET